MLFWRENLLDRDAFLRQEVEAASPVKLRWMLIRKAVGLCQSVRDYWDRGDIASGNQWVILIQEILGELLSGVTDRENETAKSITDLYVFLLLQVYEANKNQDSKKLGQVQEVLEIDMNTWQLFLQKELPASADVELIPHEAHQNSMGAPIGSFDASMGSSLSLNLEA